MPGNGLRSRHLKAPEAQNPPNQSSNVIEEAEVAEASEDVNYLGELYIC